MRTDGHNLTVLDSARGVPGRKIGGTLAGVDLMVSWPFDPEHTLLRRIVFLERYEFSAVKYNIIAEG